MRFAGILGLSLPGMKRQGTHTFLERVKTSGKFKHVLMSFYFPPLDSKGTSFFMLGGVNTKYFQGPIKYYKVDDPSYWKIHISRIRVNQTQYNGRER